ncbi:MAG: nucleotidyltransferase domain-containing protein [Candidatus Aminicenantes bacterium]|nr:nucleotidyltransferase domain-containing protein [Candidatus Aminicenantes bacterium]
MIEDSWVKRFKKEILPHLISDFEPERVIVFGSRITGQAREESDIDIVIISDFFENIPFLKRMPLVLRKRRFTKHVDYICYTPAEFQRLKTRSTLLMEALENGKRVA